MQIPDLMRRCVMFLYAKGKELHLLKLSPVMSKFFATLLLLVGLLGVNAQDTLHRYFIGSSKRKSFYEFTYRTSVEEGKPDRILVQVDDLVVDSVHVPFNIIEKVVKATSYMARMNLMDTSTYRLYQGSNPLVSIGIFERGEDVHLPSNPSLYISWKYMGKDEHGSLKTYQMYTHFDLKGNLINYKIL